MDLVWSFLIFAGAMLGCIATGHTMVIALFAGLAAFALTAVHRGFSVREIGRMGASGLKDAIVVVEVMFIIGFITAVWRASGTIAFFVYYGIRMITPPLFLLITFLLCCLLSYALGTSFGVAGTVGVIFMALARSGGVSEVMTAAVIFSGIYFGDRGSPVSSSAVLVANVTRTDLMGNVKMMMRTGLVPLLLCTAAYGILSFLNPIHSVDQSFLDTLQGEFTISPWCLLPAVCMLLLPLLHVSVIRSMLASIVTGMGVSLFVQHMDLLKLLQAMVTGYETDGPLGGIINGGGMVSMIEVVFIVGLSSTYSGIFSGTDMLAGLQGYVKKMTGRIGRFGSMVVISIVTLCVFCNQTIASMMCCDILRKPYEEAGASKEELAMDIENSVIVLCAVVPWTLACRVPLAFLQIDYRAVPLAFMLYLIPVCYAIQKKVANPFRGE
ncbi:MAG: Na+/H+ antiporter NhaC family protein [Emergencia sp.]